MNKTDKKLEVLIAYNVLIDIPDFNYPDLISEAAVRDEAEDVYEAIEKIGYLPRYFPIKNFRADFEKLMKQKPDVIFNLCEGYQEEAIHEMHIAGLWELMGIPYTGNSPLTLGLAQNKVLTKKLLESKKIPTPMYQVFAKSPKSFYIDFPVIAKPAREDASLGISTDAIIYDFDQLLDKVNHLLEEYKQPVLVEKYIEGREFNISILGNSPVKALPVSEINFSDLEPDEPRITSYEAKWLPDHPLYQKTPAVCPAMVDGELKRRLQDIAMQVFLLLNGRDYGRVDVRVDDSEKIYVLEYNPNPDISARAGFARALRAAGIEYHEFVYHLIEQAIHRNCYD
jgi:D-alanine-D-alanine ligase